MKNVIKKMCLFVIGATAAISLASCGNNDNNNDSKINQLTKDELKGEFLKEANEVVIQNDTVTVVDANDEIIILDKKPENVINLYSSFTTLWYEAGGVVKGCIGGTSAIELYVEYIGRDITQDENVEVMATSASCKKWSVETILAKQPDLIICSKAMNGYSTIAEPAEAANVPVLAVEYDDFSDYLKWFKVFCNLTGNESLWDSIALDALDRVVDVIVETKDLTGPRVFNMFSGTKSFQANTTNTVCGMMIEQLGGKNIVSDWENTENSERLDINLEAVYAANPEMIVVQCHDTQGNVEDFMNETYGDSPIWQSIMNSVNNEVIFLPKTLFHNKPNRKFADAYQHLAKILYPNHTFSFEE